jgi:hypothetical protein
VDFAPTRPIEHSRHDALTHFAIFVIGRVSGFDGGKFHVPTTGAQESIFHRSRWWRRLWTLGGVTASDVVIMLAHGFSPVANVASISTIAYLLEVIA